MKSSFKKLRGFTLVELLVVIVIIASLAGIATPQVFKQLKKADMSVATSNAKQVGMAMLDFANEYGTYPSTSTATVLSTNFPSSTIVGGSTSANDYFRQLFQAGIVQSEEIFYAKARSTIKPDGNISSTSEALKSGEVGFGYFLDGTNALSTSNNPSLPILATPLALGSTTQFDADPFDKKAVMLRIDNSVTQPNIVVTGNATVGIVNVGGANILSGSNGLWPSGSTPTIVAPLAVGK